MSPLTPEQTALFTWLRARGPASAPELAASLGRPDPSVRADLVWLESVGLIERRGGAWRIAAHEGPTLNL